MGEWWPFRVVTPTLDRAIHATSATVAMVMFSHYTHPLSIFSSYGGVYPVPLGLHAASSLFQCLSLESLDRYSLCALVGVISCVAGAFFGL